MPRSLPVLACFSLAWCAIAVAGRIAPDTAGAQGLSLRSHELAVEGRDLGRDALFARIDSLEQRYDDAEGEPRGRLAHRLGQLYLATDLRKHRRLGIEYLEEAIELSPAERFDAARLRSLVAQEMEYGREALRWMEDLESEHPHDPRPPEMLGRLRFLQARGRMRMDLFEEARRSFARAIAVDSTAIDAWYGLAASSVALGELEDGMTAVRALGRLAPERVESLFLEGALAVAAGEEERAHRAFTEALARSDDDVRAVFADGEGFLEASDLERIAERVVERPVAQAALLRLGEPDRPGEDIDWSRALEDSLVRQRTLTAFWSGLNDRPTQVYNPQELQYWCRLVEADVLFGDPDAGLRGWHTPPGATLVRWGRPTSTFYDAGNPSGGGSILDDLDRAGVRLLPGETVPSGVAVWAWTYRRPDVYFSLIFTDPSMNARWSYGESSALSAATFRRQQPLLFAPPERASSPWRLSVSRAVFPRGNDHAMLETLIGLRPTEEFLAGGFEARPQSAGDDRLAEGPTVEWALYDESDRRVDYREERCGEEHRRASLHRALDWENDDTVLDPYVLPIGALLPAGNYRLAVEAWGPGRRGHDVVVLDVTVPPSEPPSLLEMSDLQLASAFAPYRPGAGVPSRYAKYGQVVVPVPDLRVPSRTSRVGVYFEVRNLAADAEGRTRFDVQYEVFASSREVRNLALVSGFARRDLDRIDPLTLTFLEERTGMSEEGLVVKGTVLEVGDLGVGDYVLVVTVRDRIGGREASRALPFRKRGD